MQRKTMVILGLAVISVVVLVTLSTVTVFALVGGSSAQPDAGQVVPVRAESISQPQVAEPVLRYERADYAGPGGGCSHSSRLEMTQAPAQKVGDQLLTQVVE
jgi:hypothetical protein